MKAMLLNKPGQPLVYSEVPVPQPNDQQLLLKVLACGVCRTDLHIIDGELPEPRLPLIPGHEIVGEVVAKGSQVTGFSIGDRVGVAWLGWTCQTCDFCLSGRENLCDQALFTGYQIDGGYAEMTVSDHRYCFPLKPDYSDLDAAPLLCAGLIGYRALRFASVGKRLGIYGFGAAAHIVAQVAIHRGHEIYAFTRENDIAAQDYARELGAIWAGSSEESPPQKLDAALIFAPVGSLIPRALEMTSKGATVVCAGIHMSDIPSFPYSLLWGERELKSVAHLTRADGRQFLELASSIPVKVESVAYPLSEANKALEDLRNGRFNGAAVLIPDRLI